jgi:choice-of-anchor A domain-containing protein
MKNFLNILSRCTGMVVAGMVCLNSFTAYGQCPVTNDLTIPEEYLAEDFNGDGNFNAVVFGNFNTGDGTAEGKVAVGGNFILNSSTTGYKVATNASVPLMGDNFIVNGTLTHTTGNLIDVRGNFYYGSFVGDALPSHTDGGGTNIQETGLIDFAGLKQHYISLSDNYESQAATSSPDPISSGPDLVLTGDGTVKNYVFNVNITSNNISSISFQNIPVGSGILINILNNILTIAGTGTAMSADHKARTLFNFPNATSISLNQFSLEGGVLAPNANLSAVNSSSIVGPAIIGGNITQAEGLSFKSSCLTYSLPVKLISFKAKMEGEIANLAWQTSSESNADKFIVERRDKGSNWMNIGEVSAVGESVKSESYSFADNKPVNGNNLYRLRMQDKDGTFAYSRILSVNFKLNASVKAFPNPATTQVSFTSSDWQTIGMVEVLSHSGKKLAVQAENGKSIDVTSLPQGMYLLKITGTDGNVSTQKILKK